MAPAWIKRIFAMFIDTSDPVEEALADINKALAALSQPSPKHSRGRL